MSSSNNDNTKKPPPKTVIAEVYAEWDEVVGNYVIPYQSIPSVIPRALCFNFEPSTTPYGTRNFIPELPISKIIPDKTKLQNWK